MKKTLLLMIGGLVGCVPVATKAEKKHSHTELIARITYYWPGESGQNGRQTSTGNTARGNKTVAVDPKIIPYNSNIHIPRMEKVFVAHDTGSAVKSRKASKKLGKNNIVIDVFCENKYEAYKKIKKYPMFMKILVEKPKP